MAVTAQHCKCQLEGLMGTVGTLPGRVKVGGILVVTSRPLYDHGSRTRVTRCFIYELGDVAGERKPGHDCYPDVTVGLCVSSTD